MEFKYFAVLLLLFLGPGSFEGQILNADYTSRYKTGNVSPASKSSCGGLDIRWSSNPGKCWPCGETWGQPFPTYTAVKPLLSVSLPKNITVEFDLRLRGHMEFRICPFETPPGFDVPVPYCNSNKPIIIENVNLINFNTKEGEVSTPVVLNFDESVFCPKCLLKVVYREYEQHPEVLNCQGCGSQEKLYSCALILIDTADRGVNRVRRQAENIDASSVSFDKEVNTKSLIDLNGTETFPLKQSTKIISDEQNSNWTDDVNATLKETSSFFGTYSGNETFNAAPSFYREDNFNELSSSNWTDDGNFTSNETSAIMSPVSISVDDLKPKEIPYDPNILKLVDNIGGVPIDTRSNVSWYFPEVNVSLPSSIIKAFFTSGNMSLSDYNSSIATVRFEEFLQGLPVDWKQNLPNETVEFNISSSIVAELVPIFSSWSQNLSGSQNISDGWSFSVVTEKTTVSSLVNAVEDKVMDAELGVPGVIENVVLGVGDGVTEGVGLTVDIDMVGSNNSTMSDSMEGAGSNAGLSVGSLVINSSGITTNNGSLDGGSDIKNVAFLLSDYVTLASSMENQGIHESLSSGSLESVTAYNVNNTVTENSTISLLVFEFNNTANRNEDSSHNQDRELGGNTLLPAREVTNESKSVNSVSSGLEQGSISLFESSATIGMDSMSTTGFPSGINVGTSNTVYISDSNTSIHSKELKPKSGSSEGKSEAVDLTHFLSDDHTMIQETTESNLPNFQTTKFISTSDQTVKMNDNSQTLGENSTEANLEIDKKLDSNSLSGNAHKNADSSNTLSNTDSGTSNKKLLITKEEIRTGNLPQMNNMSHANLSTGHGKIFSGFNRVGDSLILTLLENQSKNDIRNSNLLQIYDVKQNMDMLIPGVQRLDDSSLKKPQDARDVRFKKEQGSMSLEEELSWGKSRRNNDISIAQINQAGDGTTGETNNVYNVWLHEARRNSQNGDKERYLKEILSATKDDRFEVLVNSQVDITNSGGVAGTTDRKEMGDLTGSDTHWVKNDTSGFQNDTGLIKLGISMKTDSSGQFHSFASGERRMFTTGTKSRDSMIGTTKSPMSMTPDPITVKVCPHMKRLVCEPFGNYKYVPGMKWWCYTNCKDDICPADKCKCLCETRTDLISTISKAGISSIKIQETSENPTKDDLQWLHETSMEKPLHRIKTQANFNTKTNQIANFNTKTNQIANFNTKTNQIANFNTKTNQIANFNTKTNQIENTSSVGNINIDLRESLSNRDMGDTDIVGIGSKLAAEGHQIHSSTIDQANMMWSGTTPAVTSGTRVSGTQNQDETGWLAAMTVDRKGMSDIHGPNNGRWSSSKSVFEGDMRLLSTERQGNVPWSGSNSSTVMTGTQEHANMRRPNSISDVHGVIVSNIQDQSNMWLDSPGVVEGKTGLAGTQGQKDINSSVLTSAAADSTGMSSDGAQDKVRLSNLKSVVDETSKVLHITGQASDVGKSDAKFVANGGSDLPGTQDKGNIVFVVDENSGINTPVAGWQRTMMQTNTIMPERIAVAGVPYTVLRCVGAGAFRDVVSIPEWCEIVCPSGLCPETICDCTIL